MKTAMTSRTIYARFGGRFVRNLIVTLAVTAIFAFKAAEPMPRMPDPDLMMMAAR